MIAAYLKRLCKIVLQALCFWRVKMTLKKSIEDACKATDKEINSVDFLGNYLIVRLNNGSSVKIEITPNYRNDLRNIYGDRFQDIEALPSVKLAPTDLVEINSDFEPSSKRHSPLPTSEDEHSQNKFKPT